MKNPDECDSFEKNGAEGLCKGSQTGETAFEAMTEASPPTREDDKRTRPPQMRTGRIDGNSDSWSSAGRMDGMARANA